MNDSQITVCFILYIIVTTAACGGAYCLAEKFLKKLIAGEYRIKDRIRERLKRSAKLMSWLYSDEKSLSEQVYEEFCNQQVSFILTDWRDRNVNLRSMRK